MLGVVRHGPALEPADTRVVDQHVDLGMRGGECGPVGLEGDVEALEPHAERRGRFAAGVGVDVGQDDARAFLDEGAGDGGADAAGGAGDDAAFPGKSGHKGSSGIMVGAPLPGAGRCLSGALICP